MATFDDIDAPQFYNFNSDESISEPEIFFSQETRNNNTDYAAESPVELYHTPKATDTPAPSKSNTLVLRNREVNRMDENGEILNGASAGSSDEVQEELTNITNAVQNVTIKGAIPKMTRSSRKSPVKMNRNSFRWKSQENLIRKNYSKFTTSSNSNIASSSEKFVSMAEAVANFQNCTPQRYRSRSASNEKLNVKNVALKTTVPQSPFLLTKKRTHTRPQTHHILSQKEKEELELENIKKFRYKANPVNKKILQGPMKALPIEKKPATVPEPFHLSEPAPKKEIIVEPPVFRAKPAPSFSEVKLPPKPKIPVTQAITPTFIKKLPKPSPIKQMLDKLAEEKRDYKLNSKTQPVPFSFEKRDQLMMKKKEQFIQKVIEEEKKNRQFHARPIPKSIAEKIANKSTSSLDTTSSVRSEKRQEALTKEVFKAREPFVLYKRPFEPVKPDRPLTEIKEFHLNTTNRIKERAEFEKKNEQRLEQMKQLEQFAIEKKKQEEEEEIKRLRKAAVHKAQPVRKYKEVVINHERMVTVPISPQFLSAKRQNKENLAN